MATLYLHPRTRVYYYRRRVPDRLRKSLKITEFRRSLGTKDRNEAKRLAPQLAAECQRLFDSAGRVVSLSHRDIVALVADWFRQKLAVMEVEPPDEETADIIADYHREADERGTVAAYAEALARIYGRDEVDALLRAKGLPSVDAESRERLLQRLFWQGSVDLWRTLGSRAQGDYSPVPGLAAAPTYAPPAEAPKGAASVPLLDLYEAWVLEQKPVKKTADSWRSCLTRFIKFIGHDDAQRLTEEEVVRWKDELVSDNLAPGTINAKYLMAIRAALKFGKDNKRLTKNVAQGVAARAPRGSKKKMRGYSDEEARRVLTAARAQKGWRRWLPFLSAYTGTRISEPADAQAADIREIDGVAYLDLTHRKLKTEESPRVIPLHPALVTEGFLEYVQGLPKGGPLFPDLKPAKTYGKRGDMASKVLSKWVREELKITDKRVAPNHAWRHRMATLHRDAKIPRDVSRYLRGYAPEDDADEYGTHSLPVLAEHVSRLPKQG
jgi:integrase